MSFTEKIKQRLKKSDSSKVIAPSKAQTVIINDTVRLGAEGAEDDRHQQREADDRRRNEVQAAERRREEQAEQSRLEELRTKERLHEQMVIEQHKLIEQQRVEEERQKAIRERERKTIELERLKQIHALNKNETYLAYLQEAELFRKEYGKNIQCDICGTWEAELFRHRGQTYCGKHIPSDRQTTNEHRVTAGRHGSSRSYIKR